MANNKGCAYGRVTRQMLVDLKEDIGDLKSQFKEFDKKTDRMFNHLSRRIHPYIVMLITVLCAAIGVLGTIVANMILAG